MKKQWFFVSMLLFGFSRFWLQLLSQNLWFIVGAFILSSVLAYLLYRRTYPPLSKLKKVFLLSLRFLALFSLFLAFSNIILFFTKELIERPLVVVLVDNSKSMKLRGGETPGEKTIQDMVSSDFLKELKTKAEVWTYSFSDTIKQFQPEDPDLDFSGEITPIGTALKQIEKDFKGRNMKAVLLLSDGAHNFGEDPLEVAKSLDFALFTCGIGKSTPVKDVFIEKIDYPDLAYVGKKHQVKIFLSNQGFEGLKLPLILKQKEKILDQKNVVLAGSGQTQEIDLEFLVDQEGVFRYDVIAPLQDGEILAENNKRSFSLKVLKSKMNILCAAGKLNWEYTFLKRFLSAQETINLQTLVYGKTGKPVSGEFPDSKEKLDEFDLLIFIDTPGGLLRPYSGLINEFLRERPALILLGEDMIRQRDFTPFVDIMPFDLVGASISRQSYNLKLTEAGRFHPVTALSPDPFENLSLWSNLPPFLGMVGVGNAKPGAEILAEFPAAQGAPQPGIVVKTEATTKVMVVLAFPFWRWDFWLWGVDKDNQAYQSLWQNSIRWLTTPEDLERFHVKTSKLIYKSGEPIEVKAKLYDESYQKITDALVELRIESEGSEDAVTLRLRQDEFGDYSGKLGSLPPGEYDVLCLAKRDGEKIGEKKVHFSVEAFSLEDLDLNPNKELLKRLAQLTQGKYYEPEDIFLFADDVDLEEKTSQRTKKIELWSSPLLLILFVLFLSIEWYIRRASQLL